MQKVKDFYQSLYTKKHLNNNYSEFLDNLPKVSEASKAAMEADLTLEELQATMKSKGMKDTAPGPDGIPYSVYGKFWVTAGPLVLEAWKYSNEKGVLSRDQLLSTIMLLEKKGKNTEYLNNLRPITLTNCDLKIITKTFANRMSKVLEEIIHESQTAYIPGRYVHDNLRSLELIKQYCEEEKKLKGYW